KILGDHFDRKTSPGIAEVFDAHYYSRNLEAGHNVSDLQFDIRNTEHALAIAKAAISNYIDVHCNIFSDGSFSQIMNVLCNEGWVPFSIEEMGTVEQSYSDFHCVLRRDSSTMVPQRHFPPVGA